MPIRKNGGAPRMVTAAGCTETARHAVIAWMVRGCSEAASE